MSDQQTSLFDSDPGASGSGSGFGLGGATTQPLDRPKRRELTWNPSADLGLLLLRFAVGGVFFAHGMQHVFGLWGGVGMTGLRNALTAFGFRNVNVLAWVTALTELVGGAAVVLGLFTPLAAAGLLALMINAVLLKAVNGFFIAGPPGAASVELEVVLGLGAAALVLTGAGRVALENGRTWNRRPAPWGVLFLIIGVAAALAVYFLLRQR
ncbi:DoxX family protein [Pseudonocardia charpentierae]|jgi:putative oxidoreductase|uniref:DoxX family protein n=1 Tax=Pseudonocardia charpentierae TaxID=3075545 RepID=A0ABU2NC87_9PSEU|nr:DoxX family protein [Pseudonocardia sp. DSM 45834]MDT0351207.1 DoxX family protein [Pseudonocardia sp. DSM 45834]